MAVSDWLYFAEDDDLLEDDDDMVYLFIIHQDSWDDDFVFGDDGFISENIQKDLPDFSLEEVMGGSFWFDGTVSEANNYASSLGMTPI